MKRGRIPFGILSIFIVLLLNLLAASPSLHELLHPDASHAEHQCAVTLLAHGQMDSPTMDVAAVVPVQPVEFLPSCHRAVIGDALETLPPGRAPPVFFLHS